MKTEKRHPLAAADRERMKKKVNPVRSSQEVRNLLKQVLPTPMVVTNLTDDEKIEMIEAKFIDILQILGLDLRDDSLAETPRRVAKMYVREIFAGLNPDNFPKMTVLENKMKYDQMIVLQDIRVLSCCEHHLQTIEGFATVAYIPRNRVIGLSKLNRIVDFFSRRPQVQERLTKQIADCLQQVLETDHVAVHINAKHYCMVARGVQDSNTTTVTTDLRGDFKVRPETRKEFLTHCHRHIRRN